ncbi:MAG: hypothetical protein V1663_02340 [archaeon]
MERSRERDKSRDGQAKCRRCGNYWPVGDFTIEPNSKMPLCSECLKAVGDGQPLEAKPKKEIEGIKEPFVGRVDEEKVKKRCPNCNYKFNYNKLERTPEKCPYCNVKLRF